MDIKEFNKESLTIEDKNGHVFKIEFQEDINLLLVYNYDIEQLTTIKINKI